MSKINRQHVIAAFAVLAALAVPRGAALGQQDDTALFSTAVPPNVMLLVDNSGSMNNLVWHPAYNPAITYGCNTTNGGFTSEQSWSSDQTRTRCGTTRTFYVDPAVIAAGNPMRFDYRYLNWIHSLPNGDPILAELASTNNGTYSACLQAQGLTTYSRYRRARVTAAKDVLREVICNVNQAGKVRFGLAEFRLAGGSGDPNGAYVRVPAKDYDAPTYTLNGVSAGHGTHLDTAISALEGETWTPLGESLFQIYTYFMSRTAANRPAGLNGTTFPGYVYRTTTSGNYGPPGTGAQIPEDPVQYDCQKNFVVMITDGEPTKDDFDNSNAGDNTAQGFSSFTGLIGDYNADGEVEIQGASCVNPVADECALYLDDIAKYMHEHDFRPDRSGNQVIDTYTVGFTTSPQANDLLSRAAAAGNGLFYFSNNAEELAAAIVGAISDIIQKSQSFTAATVPATRTSDGGNFYTSLFVPAQNSILWEGHLKLFQITSLGDILDANDSCALLNPSPPGECKSGSIDPNAVPFWDAGDEIPPPASRDLYTSMPGLGRVGFDTGLTFSALGDPASVLDDLTLADQLLYSGSIATSVEELADEITQAVRGCRIGTGVSNACVERPWLLGDIFHSNPLVVGPPRGFLREPSYAAFRSAWAQRDKIVYAGSNDGFLHAFHAGDWDAAATPPGYDRGTGTELFGFMPWPARRNIRQLPRDTGARDYYYVDGSPAAADIWFYPTPTTTAKASDGSEWHTILTGGLRQGGRAYYALDITDPSAAGYPGYLWEFPAEDASTALKAYMGETWGQPVLTRIKVRIGGGVYERWVAIVSGGYDRSGDPNDAVNYNANATAGRAIFVLDATTGEILAEKKFDAAAPAGDPQSEMRYAISSTPSVFDLDADGYADVIYVGDLGGNLWKWVIADDPVHNNYAGDPINSTGSTAQPNWKFRKFFQATPTVADPLGATVGAQTYYHSIFFSPAGTLKSNTLWLAFGTGERANLRRAGDASSTADDNRLYSIKDLDPFEREPTTYPTLAEDSLFDVTDDATCFNLANYAGFFLRGRDAEKFVTNVEIFSYWVITSSFTPSSTTDPCGSGGTASLYLYNVYCSEGYFVPAGGSPPTGQGVLPGQQGAPVDPATRRLELGAGMPTDPKVSVSPDGTRVIVTQQDGEIENPEGPEGASAAPGQLYWREVNQ